MAEPIKFSLSPTQDETINLDFGALPVRNLELTPEQALELAAGLVEYALAIRPDLNPNGGKIFLPLN